MKTTIIRKALSVSITEIAGWLLIAGILAGVTAGSHQQVAASHTSASARLSAEHAAVDYASRVQADRDFDAMDASDAMDNK